MTRYVKLIVNLLVRLPGDLVLHIDSIVTPFGQTLWDGYAEKYQQVGALGPGENTPSMGKWVLTGTCEQPDGTAVEGCVIEILAPHVRGVVISDSRGRFEYRAKRNQQFRVQVNPSEFVSARRYLLVSAPEFVNPGSGIQVVVNGIAP